MEDVGYRDAPHPKNKQYPADTERIGIVLVCVCLCLIANVMKPNRLEKMKYVQGYCIFFCVKQPLSLKNFMCVHISTYVHDDLSLRGSLVF